MFYFFLLFLHSFTFFYPLLPFFLSLFGPLLHFYMFYFFFEKYFSTIFILFIFPILYPLTSFHPFAFSNFLKKKNCLYNLFTFVPSFYTFYHLFTKFLHSLYPLLPFVTVFCFLLNVLHCFFLSAHEKIHRHDSARCTYRHSCLQSLSLDQV